MKGGGGDERRDSGTMLAGRREGIGMGEREKEWVMVNENLGGGKPEGDVNRWRKVRKVSKHEETTLRTPSS